LTKKAQSYVHVSASENMMQVLAGITKKNRSSRHRRATPARP
jgi:hypothetical protein